MTSLIRGENTTLPCMPFIVEVDGVAPGTVDLLVFQLDATDRVRGDDDLIFYNQPTSREQAVRLLGAGTVAIDLHRIPADVHTLRVAVALDDSADASLALIKGLGVVLAGEDGTRIEAPTLGLTGERAAVLVELYRRADRWKARNISAGWDRGLAALVIEHGVTVDDEPQEPTTAPAGPVPVTPTPVSAGHKDIALIAFPVKKTFTVRNPAGESNYDVPSGFDMLHFDLEHMFEIALNGTGIDPDGAWWELSFDPDDELNEYTISRVMFTCRHEYRRDQFGVRIVFQEDGMTFRYGYRPGLDFPEWGGGVGTGPCELHTVAFDLRIRTNHAIEQGYLFEGPWMFRFVEEPERGKILEAFCRASWTKPQRWRVAPT